MQRRGFLGGLVAVWIASERLGFAAKSNGEKLADAARAQLGVTTGYDPRWTQLRYPGGDVPRSTGVCADVVIRAGRDGLGLDLQKLVHEDMAKHFDAYPARKTWGSKQADTNIDHRRVLNLEAYWTRTGARLWAANAQTAGDGFPKPIEVGDILTWLLDARLPHVGIVVSAGRQRRVVHNIGRGVEESPLEDFHAERAEGHYRWPPAVGQKALARHEVRGFPDPQSARDLHPTDVDLSVGTLDLGHPFASCVTGLFGRWTISGNLLREDFRNASSSLVLYRTLA